MKELINLFKAFAKVGVLTFGGGYAILTNSSKRNGSRKIIGQQMKK